MKRDTVEAISACLAALLLVGFATGVSFAVAMGVAWAITSIWPTIPYWPATVGIFLVSALFKSATSK